MNRYFLGHHKCATNWMLRYARDLSERFGWRFEAVNSGDPPTLSPDEESFVFTWNTWWPDVQRIGTDDRAVHLIRDPRDALVSGYWSWKVSHLDNGERILRVRDQLNRLSFEDGLLLMVDHVTSLEQLAGWEPTGLDHVLTIRYEDMLADTPAVVRSALDHWDAPLGDGELAAMVERHAFERITGRRAGDEATDHHFRKGVAGDWKNCFTPRVVDRFKAIHGQALVDLGYESGADWGVE